MRLFIAIDPPTPVQARIGPFQDRLIETRADVRWVPPANFHITIKFLCETDDALLPEISARLTKAAAQVPIFPLHIEGLARFPARGPARVIIAPVISPDQRLTKLHRLIDSGLGGMGLSMDTRALVPHLTLGRVRSNHNLNKLLRLLPKYQFDLLGTFDATAAVLYQSTLTPEGSEYRALHRALLREPAPQAGEPGG